MCQRATMIGGFFHLGSFPVFHHFSRARKCPGDKDVYIMLIVPEDRVAV